MSNLYLVFCLSCSVVSIPCVLSDILCEDSVIDSIAYANDMDMYFFTSGGYYWYIKASQFPPKDIQAKPLPKPFKKGQAAVYVDGDSGCASNRDIGVTANEKEVWIIEAMDGTNKLLAYDTKTNRWRKQLINYNDDHCIQRAKIDWSKGRPIDAMFSLNHLNIFLVQNRSYAMVDCKFICKNPNGMGADKPPHPTSDFNTVDQINGVFIKGHRELYIFQRKSYYVLNIQNSKNGKLTTRKNIPEKDILKDFFKIKTLGNCSTTSSAPVAVTQPQTPKEDDNQSQPPTEGDSQSQSPPKDDNHPQTDPEDDNEPQTRPKDDNQSQRPPEGDNQPKPPTKKGGLYAEEESKPNTDSSSNGLIWIFVAVVVIVMLLVAALVFFVMVKESNKDTKKAKSSVGGSRVSPSKATPSSMSSKPMKSKLAVNKSIAPKSGVKSSIPKK